MTDLRQTEREKALRVQGFHDGYANRAPRSKLEIVYMQAWRRGQEARQRDKVTQP